MSVRAPDSDVVAVEKVASGTVVFIALIEFELELLLLITAPALTLALKRLVELRSVG